MSLKSISGILTVGLMSAGNFLVSYLMINFSSAAQYGQYVLIFSGLMLAAGIQNAIICTPMTIRAAKMESNRREHFVSSIFSFQLLITFTVLLLAGIYDLVFAATAPAKAAIPLTFIALLSSTFLLREFLRTRGYLYKETEKVLSGEIVHFTLSAVLLIAFTIVGLNIKVVIISLCVSNCIYITLAIIGSRIRAAVDLQSMTSAASEAWVRGGKWSLPGVLATWGQNNAYVYLSGLLLSVEATAALAAIRLLLMPINILASGLNSVYKPMWAQTIADEFGAVSNSTKKLCLRLCVVIFAYTALLAVAWEYILIYLFSGNIQASLSLLFLWSVIFILQTIRSRESNMLQLLEEYRYLTLVGVPASIVCVVISSICIIKFGTSGALYGIIISELIMIMFFHKRYKDE